MCHVPVPRALWRDVQRLAVERGVTRRTLVRDALQRLVTDARRRGEIPNDPPRRDTKPRDA
jgi:hypothetical protein